MNLNIDGILIECGDDPAGNSRIVFEDSENHKITCYVSREIAQGWSGMLYKNVLITVNTNEAKHV